MRLFEHRDFPTLVIAAAEHFGMPPHFVEKDYYVTEPPHCPAKPGRSSDLQGGYQSFKGMGADLQVL